MGISWYFRLENHVHSQQQVWWDSIVKALDGKYILESLHFQNFRYQKPLVWTSPRLPSFVMDSTQQSPMKFCNLMKGIFQGGLAIVRSNVQWSCFLMKSVRFLIKSILHSFPLPLLVARVRSLYYNHDGAGESWSSFVNNNNSNSNSNSNNNNNTNSNNNNNINIKLSVVVWKRSCWTVQVSRFSLNVSSRRWPVCMPFGSFCFRFLQTPKLENWKNLCNVVARHSPVK